MKIFHFKYTSAIWNNKTIVPLSLILLLTLPFDSIPLPIKAQFIPLTSLLCVMLLPALSLKKQMSFTPLCFAVITFFIFIAIHSILALLIESMFYAIEFTRIYAWLRQLMAVLAGISVFLILRLLFLKMSETSIVKAILIGALPSLFFCLLQIVSNIIDSTILLHLIETLREVLIPFGYNGQTRLSGLSFEPSTFAFYLDVIVLPFIFLVILEAKSFDILMNLFLVLTLTILGATFSSIGLVVLGCMLIISIFHNYKKKYFFLFILMIGGVYYILNLIFPYNYMILQIKLVLRGYMSDTLSDRFYGTISPFFKFFNSYIALGYGLGGTATHFYDIIPEQAQRFISSVRWENMPSLSTLMGRIFTETGLLGLTLFAMIPITGFMEINKIKKSVDITLRKNLLYVARIALIGTLAGYTIGFGSFALPYLWFWLALIDSRYILTIHKAP